MAFSVPLASRSNGSSPFLIMQEVPSELRPFSELLSTLGVREKFEAEDFKKALQATADALAAEGRRGLTDDELSFVSSLASQLALAPTSELASMAQVDQLTSAWSYYIATTAIVFYFLYFC